MSAFPGEVRLTHLMRCNKECSFSGMLVLHEEHSNSITKQLDHGDASSKVVLDVCYRVTPVRNFIDRQLKDVTFSIRRPLSLISYRTSILLGCVSLIYTAGISYSFAKDIRFMDPVGLVTIGQ